MTPEARGDRNQGQTGIGWAQVSRRIQVVMELRGKPVAKNKPAPFCVAGSRGCKTSVTTPRTDCCMGTPHLCWSLTLEGTVCPLTSLCHLATLKRNTKVNPSVSRALSMWEKGSYQCMGNIELGFSIVLGCS